MSRFSMLVFLVAALCGMVSVSAEAMEPLIVFFQVPESSPISSALYWGGIEDDTDQKKLKENHPWLGDSDIENLVTIISPGADAAEAVYPGSSIIVRGSDFTSRIRVTININQDQETMDNHEYTMRIVNLAGEDRSGPYPIELKHSDAGYIWIEPLEYIEHLTGANHPFTLYDKDKAELFTVTIRGKTNPEL